MKVRELGVFIRNQRHSAHLSLGALSQLAGVSIPYLSQIERGLRRPSADIMHAIAKALRVSGQTLYVQAGIVDDEPHPDVEVAVMTDPGLTEKQKELVLSVYRSLRDDGAAARDAVPVESPKVTRSTGKKMSGNGAARPRARSKASGRAETQAEPKPSPGSPPSSRSQSSSKKTKGGAR
jgi:transcriptional regulator with XRE-family HTH domain